MQTVLARVMEFWPLILGVAPRYGLHPELLAGLVCQESAGDPRATRVESAWRWFNFGLPRPSEYTEAEEREGQQTSWGLCQVMGTVAREKGFRGFWPELLDPATNLMLGANHLRWCIRARKGDVSAGLLRYNGGNNESYPARVWAWVKEIEQNQAGAGDNSGSTLLSAVPHASPGQPKGE